MRLTNTLSVIFGVLLATAWASPLPYDLDEIERRWAEGRSELEIHSGQTHRDMTPAWPIRRREADGFTTDARTMAHRRRNDDTLVAELEAAENPGLVRHIKNTIADFLRAKGVDLIGARATKDKRGVGSAEEVAPVLRPRQVFKYKFAA